MMSSRWYHRAATYLQSPLSMRGYAALKSTKSLEEENLNLTSEPEDAQEKTRCSIVIVLILSALVAGSLGFLTGIRSNLS